MDDKSNDMDKRRLDLEKEILARKSKEPEGLKIQGYDFNKDFDFNEMMGKYLSTGFQASHLGTAINILKKVKESREKEGTVLFFGFTSNMVSSGLRDVIRYLVQHKYVDVLVTTGGGVEEDLIKCIKPFVLGDFRAPGAELHEAWINRTGNIFVPSDRYIEFEKFLTPILSELYENQVKTGHIYNPSEIIKILGERINNEESIYYWAAKNDIPVFCPMILDGCIGNVALFLKWKKKDLKIDILDDMNKMNETALSAKKTASMLLGSGVIKHLINNANIMRDGVAYSVYINTSSEYDGSESGSEPEEAVSWGKINETAEHVKVVADATIVFPLMVASVWKK